MKTHNQIVFGFLILFLIAFKGNAQTEEVELKKSSFDVYAIHEIEVNSATDLVEFETFVKTTIAPIYNNMKGQYFTLVKGDRGLGTNKYAIILTFDSIDDRNNIYPPSGGFVGDFGDDEIWEQFNSMLDQGLGEKHTDYVKVGE